MSAVLTSASVHDSHVAIPLAQMSAQRVTALYDLMDSERVPKTGPGGVLVRSVG